MSRWRVVDAETLGASIADARRRRDLTQAELAHVTGLHRSYLSNLECGDATTQLLRLFKVLNALGLDLTLTSRDDPGRPEDAAATFDETFDEAQLLAGDA